MMLNLKKNKFVKEILVRFLNHFFSTVIKNPGDFFVLKPPTHHLGLNKGFSINEG